MFRFLPDWKRIAQCSWSVRCMAVGGCCSLLMDYTEILWFLPRSVVAAIVLLGIYFRLVDQGLSKKDDGERHEHV